MTLKSNYIRIMDEIGSRANLIAVTKKQELSTIKELYNLGHRDFGENRVEALEQKSLAFTSEGISDIRWHFIGELQSKKVAKLCSMDEVFMIHSVARLKTLKLIINTLSDSPVKIPLFLQYNISCEPQKSGFSSQGELEQAYNYALEMMYPIQGLMGMASVDNQGSEAERAFASLVSLRDALDRDLELSMGMSQDYNIALSLGSNWLRVGSSLYS